MTTKILKLLFIFLVSVFQFSCASDEKNANTPEGLFQIAKEYDEAERYEIAIQKYADLKNKFPYSSTATLAELAIADVHFKRESFSDAQISYQNFRDLHPKHPLIDYVIFRTGLSFYMQMPETIDRDLTAANDAIYHFNEVIKNFPTSKYVKEARENRDKCYLMLGEKELYVADFYFKNKKYDASLNRYENVLRQYSGYGLDPKALLGAARSADQVKNAEKKRQYAELLKSKFGGSTETQILKSEGL